MGGFTAERAYGGGPVPPRAAPFATRPGAVPARTSAASEVISAGYTSLGSDGPMPERGVPVEPSADPAAQVPLSPHSRQAPLPLPPPGGRDRTPQTPRRGLTSGVTVVSSLALVLGVFFLVAWGMRRAAPASGAALPNEVFEVLGRAPMATRQQVHLLRCGQKLVLVSVTPAGAETLTEITDPAEVDRLAGLCRQAQPNSATAAFRQVFGQFASARHTTRFLTHRDREDYRSAASDGLENHDV